VKHRATLRGLGPESSYAEVFHVKQVGRRLGARKHEKCKTTPCIKKSSLYFKDMTLRGFGMSEAVQRLL
jgi:hypothetical protein